MSVKKLGIICVCMVCAYYIILFCAEVRAAELGEEESNRLKLIKEAYIKMDKYYTSENKIESTYD